MTTKVYLIRHGETEWNKKRRYLGHTDIGLNSNGRLQAKRVRNILCGEPIHKVYASDLKRAVHFSRLIFKDIAAETMPQLREINFGVFEGMTYKEIIKKYAKIYNKWLLSPFEAIIPDGDKLKDFRKKILKTYKKLVLQNSGKTIAIVTHAGPIRMILNDILRPKNIWDIKIDNASITIVEHENKKTNMNLMNYTL
jgi:broad specificity phosphatase PhoE